ncbi:SusD/RagB family nutrient-binding outer membrane lipoprotein [Gelidibacter salicanalis]|uniref:SusD/RagB family nutrient-binding outer membrane lipoprotein n=1 Tax=Gelidibacter salicanalis TaxID=291193 RepID=A0A5C7AK18_9FLAO|nr:SusD/RagB family nutrient-binding outer membrane lipoprotein [Gelidibacter salicanalis]TXE09110.1 SusD/RagB family nutrient-binding outer membrane lipoprotein [Gelidibacter salicanalis]
MRKILKKTGLVGGVLLAFLSCSEFEEVNIDPVAAGADQVQIEYFINSSIGGAQQDPHISERVFVLYWDDAGHMTRVGTLSEGSANDGWTSDYYNGYVSKWLRNINAGINIADEQIASGSFREHTPNLREVARIWRAYIMSEMTDNFGPIPVSGFNGENPEYNDVQEVYYYMLKELTEATKALNLEVSNPDNALKKLDPAYGYDYAKWKKYGNSLRMRLAMRLSEVDPAKAQAEFEAAVADDFIKVADDNFSIKEEGGWSDYTGVMTREWWDHEISATLNNLMIGLGGIPSADVLSADKLGYIKPANYLGLKFENHFTSLTNDPSAGYFFDGLHKTIDPRAYDLYVIPGDYNDPEFNSYPSWTNGAKTTKRNLVDATDNVVKEIDAAFTWNAYTGGDWGEKGAKNKVYGFTGTLPRLANKYRNGTNERIFFASWESHFLIAEAAVRGWAVPLSGKAAYEQGIAESFAYNGVTAQLSDYLTSQDFSRVGTSVSWDHTTEPPSTVAMTYKDGYTGAAGTVNVKYPENTIYKNGTVKNDLLTKIITQKFIAQTPWLPLETWSDHRRLGLPFFENPAIEKELTNLPALNTGNYMGNSINFFGQRLKYPSNFGSNIPAGYAQAVDKLGGPDTVFTPLWWAQQN